MSHLVSLVVSVLSVFVCVCVCVCQEAVPSGFSSGDVLIPLADEYDPMFPNDYEKVVKRHREERQKQREHERLKEIEEREKYGPGFLTHSSPVNKPIPTQSD